MIWEMIELLIIFSIIPTIIIEFIVYSLFIRKEYLKLLSYAVLINVFTWPLAHLFIGNLISFFYIEFFVFLIEFPLIMLLFRIKWWKALIISFVANLITMLIGLFLGFI
ncbi:MAG: hypothetical protein ABIA78_01000 [archaeon]